MRSFFIYFDPAAAVISKKWTRNRPKGACPRGINTRYDMSVNRKLRLITSSSIVVIILASGIGLYEGLKRTSQKQEIVVPNANGAPIAPLYRGTLVEQSFVSKFSNITKASFLGATYLQSNLPGTGMFQLLDSAHVALVSQSFPLSALNDNSYFSVSFKSVAITPGQKYFLTLTTDVKAPATTFTLYRNKNLNEANLKLTESGKTVPGSIIFNLTGN